MSAGGTAVPVSGSPACCWCKTIRLRFPSANTTTTSGSFSDAATDSSVAVMAKPPSPHSETTGSAGPVDGPRATEAPIAAGSPKPIADSPLVISACRGAGADHAWPVMSLCDPTSAVTTVPAGAAARVISTTSDGFSAAGS